jgi:hypothetical protein
LVAMCALLFSPCVQAHAGLFKPDVDYSNYNVPLFDQVVNRIKAKVAARLGEGENTVDRYFIVPFAYQHRGNKPALAHSFISVIRVFADNKQPHFTPGLRQGQFRNRNFDDPLPATGQGISLAFDECNGVIFCLFCCFLLMKGC